MPAPRKKAGRFSAKRGGGTLLGEKVFPEFITLRSDPFDPRQPSSPWTGDWLPAQALTWVDKGVIANLAYDRYWAEKTGKQPMAARAVVDAEAAVVAEASAAQAA